MPQPRKETVAEFLGYWLRVPLTWARMAAHNTDGILHVLDIIRFRPMKAGMIAPDHPWMNGLQPDGTHVWPRNIIFRSPRDPEKQHGARTADPDETIVTKVGNFMAAMVKKSIPSEPEIPWGPRRRMPHGINYLHGAVHYNAGFLIFENFAGAIFYFSDKKFRKEIQRFAREERREILLVFRDREYDLREFGYFAGFLRSVLPWFSNSNGPKQRVMWGNPAPYAVVNIITGNWKIETYKVKNPAQHREMARAPITPGVWFQRNDYCGTRCAARWPEKLLAVFTTKRIKLRGEKENLFFVDRRKLLRRYTPEEIAADPHV